MHLDSSVIALALVLALVISAIGAVSSALTTARGVRPGSLALASPRLTSGRLGIRIRGSLVAAETAFAFVLLISASLLFQSLTHLWQVDPGFRTDQTLTAELNLNSSSFPDRNARIQFFETLVPALGALPGVISAGAVSVFPMTGTEGGGTSLHVQGASESVGYVQDVGFRVATPDYFNTVGIPVLSGRIFDRTVDLDGSMVRVIINETLAELLWPGEDASGKTMLGGHPDNPRGAYEVIGVVGDVHESSLTAAPRPHLYLDYPNFTMSEMVVALRTSGPSTAVRGALEQAVLEVNANQPVEAIQSVEQILSRVIAQPRFTLLLFTFFAGSALLLSAIGIYGVTAHSVVARTHEIGVRMAIGASARGVVVSALGRGLRQAAIGIAAGALISLQGARLLSSLVFGIDPHDATTYLVAAAVLIAVAGAAALIPSIRAARINPARVLGTD